MSSAEEQAKPMSQIQQLNSKINRQLSRRDVLLRRLKQVSDELYQEERVVEQLSMQLSASLDKLEKARSEPQATGGKS